MRIKISYSKCLLQYKPKNTFGTDESCLLGEVVDIEVHIRLKKDRLNPSDVSSIVIDDHLYIEKLKLSGSNSSPPGMGRQDLHAS